VGGKGIDASFLFILFLWFHLFKRVLSAEGIEEGSHTSGSSYLCSLITLVEATHATWLSETTISRLQRSGVVIIHNEQRHVSGLLAQGRALWVAV